MRISLFICVSGLACLFSGCASTNTLTLRQAGFSKDQVDAPGIFAENSATCHGRDGRARTFHGRLVGAQNFTDARWQADETEIIHAIKTGPGAMPAFQKKLSAPEIEALAAYVATFKPVH